MSSTAAPPTERLVRHVLIEAAELGRRDGQAVAIEAAADRRSHRCDVLPTNGERGSVLAALVWAIDHLDVALEALAAPGLAEAGRGPRRPADQRGGRSVDRILIRTEIGS